MDILLKIQYQLQDMKSAQAARQVGVIHYSVTADKCSLRERMFTQDEELQAMWVNREAIGRSLQRFVTLHGLNQTH